MDPSKSSKDNRKDQQFESEVLLLKEAFCRVSKRLVLLEDFLKYKFASEFPPASANSASVKINTKNRSKTQKNPSTSSYSLLNRIKTESLKSPNVTAGSKVSRFNPTQSAPEDSFPVSEELSVYLEHNDLNCSPDGNHYDAEDMDCLPSIESEVLIEHGIACDLNENNGDSNNSASEMDDTHGHDDNSDYEDEGTDDAIPSTSDMNIEDKTFDSDRKTSQRRKWALKRKRAKLNRKNDQLTCKICKKIFLGHCARGNLKAHMDIHSSEKKYKCTECDKAFHQRKPLRTHVQRIHFKDKYSVHACRFCGKTFIAAFEKKQHEAIHAEVKSYVCEICGFKCKLPRYLKDHMKTPSNHKDLPSHNVEVCPDGKQLKNHVCDICSIVVSSAYSLKRHVRKIHGTEADPPTLQSNKSVLVEHSEVAEAVSSILPGLTD